MCEARILPGSSSTLPVQVSCDHLRSEPEPHCFDGALNCLPNPPHPKQKQLRLRSKEEKLRNMALPPRPPSPSLSLALPSPHPLTHSGARSLARPLAPRPLPLFHHSHCTLSYPLVSFPLDVLRLCTSKEWRTVSGLFRKTSRTFQPPCSNISMLGQGRSKLPGTSGVAFGGVEENAINSMNGAVQLHESSRRS